MERNYRFRVYVPEKKTMLYQSAHSIEDFAERVKVFGGGEWMLNSGVPDNTGKEIHAGDIVLYKDTMIETKFIAEFDPKNGWTGTGTAEEWPTLCTVIGNVYESPEKLNQEVPNHGDGIAAAAEGDSTETEERGEVSGPALE